MDVVHLREKGWSDQEVIKTILLLQSKGIPSNKIMVNSNADIAYKMKTLGVQLTHHSMDVSMARHAFPNLTIGCSVHSVKEAMYAESHHADHVLYGHVFESTSKLRLEPKGLEALQKVSQHVSTPVIAIGGITPGNTGSVIQHGASGIAILSGILLANDPVKQAINYKDALRKVATHEENV